MQQEAYINSFCAISKNISLIPKQNYCGKYTHLWEYAHGNIYEQLGSSLSRLVSMAELSPGCDSCSQLSPIDLNLSNYPFIYFQTSWFGTLTLLPFCPLPKTPNRFHPHFYCISPLTPACVRASPLTCCDEEIWAYIHSFSIYLLGICFVQQPMFALWRGKWIMQIVLGQNISY